MAQACFARRLVRLAASEPAGYQQGEEHPDADHDPAKQVAPPKAVAQDKYEQDRQRDHDG